MVASLEDRYMGIRRPLIRWIPGQAPLTTAEIRCFCYRIQIGTSLEKALVELPRTVNALRHAVQDAATRIGMLRPLEPRRPALVGGRVFPAPLPPSPAERATADEAAMKEIAEMPMVRRVRAEIEHLYRLYDDLAQEEWGQLSSNVRYAFSDRAKSSPTPVPGWQYYRYVRQFYYADGILDPPAILNQIREPATFLGLPLIGGAHPKLLERLRQAEREVDQLNQALGQQHQQSMLRSWMIRKRAIGCFVPRPLEDQTAGSNHAVGLAIDIDADWNPFLQGAQAKLLDELLRWCHATGLVPALALITESWVGRPIQSVTDDVRARELYDKASMASEAVKKFLLTYLDAWLRVQTGRQPAPTLNPDAEAYALTGKMIGLWGGKGTPGAPEQSKGYKALARLRTDGLITLPMQLFVALIKAGLRSGVEYHGKKDVMHFELVRKDVLRLRKPKNPCS